MRKQDLVGIRRRGLLEANRVGTVHNFGCDSACHEFPSGFESVKLKLSCKAKPTATSTIHVLVLGFAWITLVSGTGILKAVPLRRALFLMGTLPGCGSQHIYTTIVDGLMDRHGCI